MPPHAVKGPPIGHAVAVGRATHDLGDFFPGMVEQAQLHQPLFPVGKVRHAALGHFRHGHLVEHGVLLPGGVLVFREEGPGIHTADITLGRGIPPRVAGEHPADNAGQDFPGGVWRLEQFQGLFLRKTPQGQRRLLHHVLQAGVPAQVRIGPAVGGPGQLDQILAQRRKYHLEDRRPVRLVRPPYLNQWPEGGPHRADDRLQNRALDFRIT